MRAHVADYIDSLARALHEPAIRWLLLGSCVRYFGGYTIASFAPLFFERYFGGNATQYAVANAFVVCVGGLVSSLGGGWLADRWSLTSPQVQQPRGLSSALPNLYMPLSCWSPGPTASVHLRLLAGCPVHAGRCDGPEFLAGHHCLFPRVRAAANAQRECRRSQVSSRYLLAESWFGPAFSTLQAVVPPDVVGVASSVFACLSMLVSRCFCPVTVGCANAGALVHRSGVVHHRFWHS